MRRFVLRRDIDQTGVSGTGDIAEGVQWTSGEVSLKWRTEYWACAFYLNMAAIEKIHGHSGRTRIVWIDPEPMKAREALRESGA